MAVPAFWGMGGGRSGVNFKSNSSKKPVVFLLHIFFSRLMNIV
jgi:hypothetical protein